MRITIRILNYPEVLQQSPQISHDLPTKDERFFLQLVLIVHHDGALWRGLQPLLMDSPTQIARRALKQLIRFFSKAVSKISHIAVLDELDAIDSHHTRKLQRTIKTAKRSRSLEFLIVPPYITRIQRSFSTRLVRYEHLFITLTSLSAWIATLGGGYFLCRHLTTAIQLARQQRALALFMGDYETADKCTLNEAFNYIHAGYFRMARDYIAAVQITTTERGDVLTLRMADAAMLFLRRVRRAAKKEQKRFKDETQDDFARIRIVSDRSISR